jgi:DNA invertase Pin-like site-specific DNA recombinase
MERPGLKQLLTDIKAGKVDVIVVYKIDRLTRSLADFVRMVELFDRHEVSFVSVTQSFSTTSSMGRLTLNVLLSFAQYERELTGERIRDKIAASKAKGMWLGGALPLGYDLPVDKSRTLIVNETEADTVRLIFSRYLELGAVNTLEAWLDEHAIRSKQRTTTAGKVIGGLRFSRGALYHLLRMIIGWRLQAHVHGGLDGEVRRKVRKKATIEAEGLDLGAGTTITRLWQGRTYEIEIEDKGFRWEGTVYPSLSAVATAITGVRQNGPRFFGMRDDRK